MGCARSTEADGEEDVRVPAIDLQAEYDQVRAIAVYAFTRGAGVVRFDDRREGNGWNWLSTVVPVPGKTAHCVVSRQYLYDAIFGFSGKKI